MNNLVTNFRVLSNKEYYVELENKSCYLVGMDGYLINYDEDLIRECEYKTSKVAELQDKIEVKERMVLTNARLFDERYTKQTNPSSFDIAVAGDLYYNLWFDMEKIEILRVELKLLAFELQQVSNKVKTRMELMADAILPSKVCNTKVTEDIITEIRNCYVLGYSLEETSIKLESFGVLLSIDLISTYLSCYKDCRVII